MWCSLNGLWEWEPAKGASDQPPPTGKTLTSRILVPFPIESCLSGVAPNSSAAYVERSWYRLLAQVWPSIPSNRIFLRFGAANWQADVFINGVWALTHTGGYDGFAVELTPYLETARRGSSNPLELLVGIYNPADRGKQPNGKARISAISHPGGDTYTPASGLWQSVWMEEVPTAFVSGVRIGMDAKSVTVVANVDGGDGMDDDTDGTTTRRRLTFEVMKPGGAVVATGVAASGAPLTLAIPTPTLWSPDQPFLYDLRITCDACGESVMSYFGLRTFVVANVTAPLEPDKDGVAPRPPLVRPLLNGRFVFLAGWLDQSYWPDGIYTAPTDAALAFDLSAVAEFGLNTVRLHQKVNPERWYYHADRIGVLVMQDAVQKYGFATGATVPLFESDLVKMIEGRGSHTCIVQWETFNEGDCWHAFHAAGHTVQDIVALAKRTDWQKGRPVDTDSGGRANSLPVGDVNDIHTYPWPGKPLPTSRKYAMLGEFGGIGAFVTGKEWVPGKCHTYLKVETPAAEAGIYVNMSRMMLAQIARGLSASIYTQIADVELECDGFLNYDRSAKFTNAERQAVADANAKLISASAAAGVLQLYEAMPTPRPPGGALRDSSRVSAVGTWEGQGEGLPPPGEHVEGEVEQGGVKDTRSINGVRAVPLF